MKQHILKKNIMYPAMLFIGTILFAALCLMLLTFHDNKYMAKAEIVQDNTVQLSKSGICFLIDDWEMYPDCLLAPADFSTGNLPPHYTVQAGEYPNLSLFHRDKNPYGPATYRIRICGNGIASLYLPEPQCASLVYAGGQLLGKTGEVSSEAYRPLVKDSIYTFPVSGETELIIQISNYTHYYGGLWYPPALGDADGISRLVANRMIFYGLLFFTSLTLTLVSAAFWLTKQERRNPAAFYFGLLCAAFTLRTSYPFLRFWGVPSVRLCYAIEDAAALLGIFFMVQIIRHLFLPEGFEALKNIASVLSLGMVFATVIIPLFLLPAFPSFIRWYGPLISWYKLLMAVFFIGAVLWGCFLHKPQPLLTLSAATANGVFLFFGTFSIGRFEPIAGAWPEEYGSFCMVLSFAVLTVRRSLAMTKENLRLNEHLQEEVEEKTLHLRQLLTERGQLMTELGHDIKSPLTSLSNMAQIILINDIMLDEETKKNMEQIQNQCGILAERVSSISRLASEIGDPITMEPLSLNRFLADFYHINQPIVELTGPDFLCRLTSVDCTAMANSQKLSRALENLVFNAADFTPPEGKITLSLEREGQFACIRVADTGCGIDAESLPRVFDRSYTTRAQEGGQGLGLAITRTIVLEHNGEISVDSSRGNGTVFTIRLPLRLPGEQAKK